MPHLPGHKYLGPGTEDFSPEPVDLDDQIARVHDLAYAKAGTSGEVRAADKSAIRDFASDFLDGGNFHSAVGAIGLGAKHGLETIFGQQYPRMSPPQKRRRPAADNPHLQQEDADDPSAHKGGGGSGDVRPGTSGILLGNYQRWIDEVPQGSQETAEQLSADNVSGGGTANEGIMDIHPQAGSSLPGGTGADVSATVITGSASRNTQNKTTFKKCFQFYTGAFQFTHLTNAQLVATDTTTNFGSLYSSTTGAIGVARTSFTATPLAIINPNCLPYYMDLAEFGNLPNYAYATQARIKVTPLGYRLPFATNEADSSFANSQTLVQICHAVGLNNQMNMFELSYIADPTDLTLVTGVNQILNLPDILYGQLGTIGANIGVPRHLNRYTILECVSEGIAGAVDNHGTPNLLQMMKVQNVNDCKGTPIINYKYNFKNGLLQKDADTPTQYTNMNTATEIDNGMNNAMFTTRRHTGSSGVIIYNVEGDSTNGLTFQWEQIIDKAPYLTNQQQHQMTPDQPPLVHFGCMPVQSNAALAATPTFANAVIQWQVEFELDVHFHFNYIHPFNEIPYLMQFDPSMGNDRGGLFNNNIRTRSNAGCAYISNRRVAALTTGYAAKYPLTAPPTLLEDKVEKGDVYGKRVKRKTVVINE